MKIGEHGVREHIRLLTSSFALVAIVWIIRLSLSIAGVPSWVVKLSSVTVATPVAVMLAAVLLHARGYRSYASIVVASLMINIWAECLIVLAILFTILTGIENIYSTPEFTGGESQWAHIHGHITFGLGFGTLVGAAVGCLLFWLLRTLLPTVGSRDRNKVQGIHP